MTETCDWCDAKTPRPKDQHRVDINGKTWWLCSACYNEHLSKAEQDH